MAEDQAAVARATKVIGGHKSQITRAMVILERVVNAGAIPENDRATVKSGKLLVEKQVTKIEAQIDALLGNDNFTEDDLNALTDYMLDKGNMIQEVAELLDAKSAAERKGDVSLLGATSLSTALSESLIQAQARHLSQADLPTFNGEEAEFIPFMEAFNFLVHENDSIPDSMKAHHLKKCMTEKGPSGSPNSAHDLLKHISPTAANYKLMTDKLEKRFKLGYTSRAVYITKLRKLSTWKPCHSATDLRKLYDYINENLELLKLAGGSDLNESDILLAEVLAIIPNFLVNDFLKLSEKDRSLQRLLTDMDQAVSRMFEKEKLIPKSKHASNSNTNNTNTNKPYSSSQRGYGSRPTYSYQVTDDDRCLFCSGNHSAFNCNAGNVQTRLNTVKEQGLCPNCLRRGHFAAECKVSRGCQCGTGKAHCKALCFRSNQQSIPQHNSNSRGRGGGGNRGTRGKSSSRGRVGASNADSHIALPTDQDVSNNALADSECFMEIAVGYIKSANTGNDVEVRFFLDSGSSLSLSDTEKIRRLKYDKVGVRDVSVSTLGGNVVECQDCDIVKLMVKDRKNLYPPTEICISVLDVGRQMVQSVKTWPLTTHQARRVSKYQLSDEQQTSGKILPIDILIGLDHYWKFMHRRIDDPGFGPVLRSSKLGWILSGQRDYANPRLLTTVSHNPLTHSVQSLFVNTVNMSYMSDKLGDESVFFASKSLYPDEEEYNARFSDLETFGIKPEQEISPILSDFNSTIKFNEETKRYQVQLPLIGKFLDKLEDGYFLSKTRLDSLLSKLRDPAHADFAKMYYAVIEEQEKLGVIERVSDMSSSSKGKVCYIPHHGVFKHGSNKLRVVYDGSSKSSKDKVSLNDCLSPGPSLTNELIEMLLRFRTHDVVLTGDIEKAFLQIEVDETNRDYLRFLWYDQDGNLVVYRFARVPFGLTCSSFLLNATLRFHMQKRCLEEGNPDLLTLLSKSHYVDDWLIGAKTSDDVLLIKHWLTEFLNTVGMKLHKFNSNSETVRQHIEADCPERDSVLGVPWNTRADEISLNIQKVLDGLSCENTKRELYSLPAQVFDLLGFLQPFMFQAKLMFQEVCKAKIKWKGKLPTNIKDRFERWRKQIYKLATIKLPRQVVLPNYDRVELHGFGDASQLGYCACIYMVSKNSTVNISRLILSKTRVAPLKELTIPRLELTAGFLLARLMRWSLNSMIVLILIGWYTTLTRRQPYTGYIQTIDNGQYMWQTELET